MDVGSEDGQHVSDVEPNPPKAYSRESETIEIRLTTRLFFVPTWVVMPSPAGRHSAINHCPSRAWIRNSAKIDVHNQQRASTQRYDVMDNPHPLQHSRIESCRKPQVRLSRQQEGRQTKDEAPKPSNVPISIRLVHHPPRTSSISANQWGTGVRLELGGRKRTTEPCDQFTVAGCAVLAKPIDHLFFCNQDKTRLT